MFVCPIGSTTTEPSATLNSAPQRSVDDENGRFDGLRSVKWRINLGILPSSPPSSVDDLRRVTADSRRSYAGLRRRLLVDPNILKEESRHADVVSDDPLSLNPDSNWGRYFRNAELEKMVDSDLSRLYPEHGSYFQTQGCQGMLRRILLLWCIGHAEFGYRQGMHELLAPLLYVLHVDVERLLQVRKQYEVHYTDKFDGLSYHDNNLSYDIDLKNLPNYADDEVSAQQSASKVRSLNELNSEIQTVVLMTDAYGAEGELGVVISEKFLEHDAYCMFDALMRGTNGSVAMAEFFSPSPASKSQSGLSPIIEASAALFHLLSCVDSSLHSHLVELGVEPQYFALRWFRVLFGREFSLEDLLIIWDEIFALENGKLDQAAESSFFVLCSSRGAFISAMAVSMLLYLRSYLLSAELATSCLQRLLNFPDNVDVKKLLEKAKSLQTLALNINVSYSPPHDGMYNHRKSTISRGHSDSFDSASPKTPLCQVPVSYWEEKWRVHNREEDLRQGSLQKHVPTQKKRWTERVKLGVSRTESDPTPRKISSSKRIPKSSVRRRLLEDLSRELGLEEGIENTGDHEVSKEGENLSAEVEGNSDDDFCEDITETIDDRSLSGNGGSEESSSIFSGPNTPRSGTNDQENVSEKCSVASNSSLDESDDSAQTDPEELPLPISHPPHEISQPSDCKDEPAQNSISDSKEKKPFSVKLQWFWKFGRNAAAEGTSEKVSNAFDATKSPNPESNPKTSGPSAVDGPCNSLVSPKGDAGDQNVMGTLKNLGHSMLEQIQVIESVFQQDRGAQVGPLENSKNTLVGKGQVTAMAALKELRKISHVLSEM